MEKLPKITKAKQVGQNFTIVIGEDTITLKGSKEVLAPAKEAAKKYEEKSTKANYTALMKLMKPETTKKEEETAKKVEAVKTKIKVVKNQAKEANVGQTKTTAKIKKAKVNLVKELESQMADSELSESDAEAMRRLLAKSDAKKQVNSSTSRVGRRGEH